MDMMFVIFPYLRIGNLNILSSLKTLGSSYWLLAFIILLQDFIDIFFNALTFSIGFQSTCIMTFK